ncbi:MAG: flagellar biosynthetic protein FliO [Balneolales bacterium]
MDLEKLNQQIKNDPRKTLRFVIGLSFTLVVLWVMILIQTETGPQDGYVNIDSLSTGAEPAYRNQPEGSSVTQSQTEEEFPVPVRSILLAALVIGGGVLLYSVYLKSGKATGTEENGPLNLKIHNKIEVAPGQTIAVVQVHNEIWVIGSTAQGVNVLKQFDKHEWPQEKLKNTYQNGIDKGFSEMFNRKKRKPSTEG